ncbi:MAG: hypothetical protein C5B43_01140 [Verrucomicrobia bacterium]|nr:MAG: hypothetical protein C5B43_01140 [Verrucomicrobiota bacterium]
MNKLISTDSSSLPSAKSDQFSKGIQVGPTPNQKTIERRSNEGYSLTLDLPEVHIHLIDRLLECKSAPYFHLLQLLQTCTLFHQLILENLKKNQLLDDFINFLYLINNYIPTNFHSNKFQILACSNSNLIPDCFTKNLDRTTSLFLVALKNSPILACQAYIKIFNNHINNLLAHSETTLFKFEITQVEDQNTFDLTLLDLPELPELPINNYIFIQFLKRFIPTHCFANFVNFPAEEEFHSLVAKWQTLIQFLTENQTLEGIPELIDQLIEKLHSMIKDFDHAYDPMWILQILTTNDLIQKNAAHYLFPKLHLCFNSSEESLTQTSILYIFNNFVQKDFLSHENVQEFIQNTFICAESNLNEERKTISAALNLLATLYVKELINQENSSKTLDLITQRLHNLNINTIIRAGALSAFFTISKSPFLNLSILDSLTPKILPFLESENQEDQNKAFTLIQIIIEKTLDKTQHGYMLMQNFLILLVKDNPSRYEQILSFCIQLYKARAQVITDDLNTKLKDIAIKNSNNPNENIQSLALELFTLIASEEEQNKIHFNKII